MRRIAITLLVASGVAAAVAVALVRGPAPLLAEVLGGGAQAVRKAG